MARLSVRLDDEQRRRLDMVVETRGAPISDVVRRLIDDAYEEIMLERRRAAVERMAAMEIEDVPDPETLSRELEAAHEPGGIRNWEFSIKNWELGVMRRVGADMIVSADSDFDRIADVERLDPAGVGEWSGLVSNGTWEM